MICNNCAQSVTLSFRRRSKRPGELLYSCPVCNAPYQARERDGAVGVPYQTARKGARGEGRKQLAVTATEAQRAALKECGVKAQDVFNAGLKIMLEERTDDDTR